MAEYNSIHWKMASCEVNPVMLSFWTGFRRRHTPWPAAASRPVILKVEWTFLIAHSAYFLEAVQIADDVRVLKHAHHTCFVERSLKEI